MLTVGKRFERFLHMSGPLAYISLAVWSMDGSVVMADPPAASHSLTHST